MSVRAATSLLLTQRSHRLIDPTEQLRDVCVKLNTLLHDEYVETKDTARVLSWVDEIRQKGINRTPLIDLIGSLAYSSATAGDNKRLLILPLYNAFLRSPESKLFTRRVELYKPAIANIFKANSVSDTLASVQSFWSLFSLTPPTANQTLSPDQLGVLCDYFRAEFHIFLQRLPITEFVRILPQLSAAIRQQALFLSAPLVHAVDAVKGQPNLGKYRAAYAAFMRTEAERKLFAQRLHIYYPWMAEQLRDNRWHGHPRESTTKLGIVQCLLRRLTADGQKSAAVTLPSASSTTIGDAATVVDVPPFLVRLVRRSLPAAFNWACATRNFDAADQIWQCGINATDIGQPQQQQQQRQPPIKRNSDMHVFPTDFRFADVLAFAIHLWTIGDKMRAQKVMHFYLRQQFLSKNERNKNYVNLMLQQLNALNINYQQNLFRTAKGVNGAAEREKCHRDFVKAVHDKLTG